MIIKKGFWFCLIGFLNVNCYKSKLDCNFDYLTNAQDSGFCEWRPNFEGIYYFFYICRRIVLIKF